MQSWLHSLVLGAAAAVRSGSGSGGKSRLVLREMGRSRGVLTARENKDGRICPADDVTQDNTLEQEAAMAQELSALQIGETGSSHAAAGPAAERHNFLVYFLHRLLDFREQELTALAELAGAPGPAMSACSGVPSDCVPLWPLLYVSLPSEAVARAITARAVLIRVRRAPPAVVDEWPPTPGVSLPGLISVASAATASPSPPTNSRLFTP